jgi:hypothetical protein
MISYHLHEDPAMNSFRRTVVAVALAAASVAISSPLAAQRGTPDPERVAVRTVIQALAQNLQDGKWEMADSAFAARGLHVLVDTLALHTWAEYRDKYLKMDMAKYTDLKVAHTGIESVVRGNVAWSAWRQELSGTGAPARVARGSAVLEKVNEKWTIVHYHVSR